MLIALSLVATACWSIYTFHRLWKLSVGLKNVTIVDLIWGPGFAIIAWIANILIGGPAPHGFCLAVLATIWASRLSIHLYTRNLGKGEDPRYARMRARGGADFDRASLYSVFYAQALAQWLISMPLQWGQLSEGNFGILAYLGLLLFVFGFAVETVADGQLASFKADPNNAGKLYTRGLWAWSRHPNYFGDACVWWGMTLIAIDGTGNAWLTLSPIAMTYLLLQVTGVKMLEKSLKKTKPDYADYERRVPAFFPRRPRSE